MTQQAESANFYNGATQATLEQEARRLELQAALLGGATSESLGSRLGAFTGGQLLDIGAGVTTDVQEHCIANGVGYTPLDINAQYLAGRPPATNEPILAKSDNLPLPDGSIDVTHSRAATAWSNNPEASIAEQLRVTRAGGLAVFTEFDWSDAGAPEDTPAADAIINATHFIRIALSEAGFASDYGAVLPAKVAEVLAQKDIAHERETINYQLELGDYRDFFVGSAKTLLSLLKEKKSPLANSLETEIVEIDNTPGPLVIKLPSLVSQIVYVQSAARAAAQDV